MIATLLFMLCSCLCEDDLITQSSYDASETKYFDTVSLDDVPALANSVVNSTDEYDALQSETATIYSKLSDFLTEEQIQLYYKALEIYPLFNGMPDTIDYLYLSLQGKPWDEKNNYVVNYALSDDMVESYTINGLYYNICKGEYQTIDAFSDLCLSVFTDEYYKELNATEWGVPTFMQINNYLYHINSSKGGAFGYDPIESPDTYVLVSRTDTEICFDVIGHYAQDDTEETRSFPITLTRTESGWRFSQFADAGLDA